MATTPGPLGVPQELWAIVVAVILLAIALTMAVAAYLGRRERLRIEAIIAQRRTARKAGQLGMLERDKKLEASYEEARRVARERPPTPEPRRPVVEWVEEPRPTGPMYVAAEQPRGVSGGAPTRVGADQSAAEVGVVRRVVEPDSEGGFVSPPPKPVAVARATAVRLDVPASQKPPEPAAEPSVPLAAPAMPPTPAPEPEVIPASPSPAPEEPKKEPEKEKDDGNEDLGGLLDALKKLES